MARASQFRGERERERACESRSAVLMQKPGSTLLQMAKLGRLLLTRFGQFRYLPLKIVLKASEKLRAHNMKSLSVRVVSSSHVR